MKAAIVAFGVLLSIVAGSTFAQDARECRWIRSDGASFLWQCGNQLRSFALSMADFKRKPVKSDTHGRLWFECSDVLDCSDEPIIKGMFISAADWDQSRKDERTILEVFKELPYPPSDRDQDLSLSSTCRAFDLTIGDLKGRAACFSEPGKTWNVVVFVGSDRRIGLLLSFFRADEDANDVRKKVLAIAPKFKVERGVGDATLMRWMK